MQDHIHIRVSLAVLAIDDFTGEIIRDGSIRMELNETSKPVRKAEGFYIFTNLESEEVTLTVWGSGFRKQKRIIRVNNDNPIVKIRLKPDRTYRFKKGTTCVTGFAKPGSSVFFYSETGSDVKKLLKSCSKGDEVIGLYLEKPEEIEGRQCLIINKDKTCRELIELQEAENTDAGSFRLKEPLKESYRKIGTKVIMVYQVTADEKTGEYFLPLKYEKDREYICCRETDHGLQEEAIVLEPGKWNRYDLTEEK